MKHQRLTAVALFAALALAAGTASAQQTVFHTQMDGTQAGTGSVHTGTGLMIYDSFTGTMKYNFTITGVTGAYTVSHMHRGAPGVSGTVVFGFAGGPTTFAGSAPIAPADVALLLAGGTYVNFHSTVNPAGDIRGQVVPANTTLVSIANGTKEIPPIPGVGSGTATFTINPGNTITYSGTFSGLTGPITMSHIHDGGPTVTGGAILVGLTVTTPTTIGGTSGPVSLTTLAKIRASLAYLNVHTAANPAGEIRGQTVPNFTPYGVSCHLGGTCALNGTGIPTPGGSVTLDITGGVPGGTGLLFFGPVGDNLPIGFGCRLYVNPTAFVAAAIPLDGTGGLSIPIGIAPTTPVPSWGVAQFFGMDPGQPGGYYTTNGLEFLVDD
jgi:hypothetical protein